MKICLQISGQHFEFYTIALDESTVLTDTEQVAIFVIGINATSDITEELASLVSLKDTTTGVIISQAIKSVIDVLGLNLNNLCGITTDGAPPMVGKMNGAVSLIEKEMRNAGIERQLVRTHCICVKSLQMHDVMQVVIKIVNFMRARGLYHRQFQHMLEEMENQYGDLFYYCEVRWLSRGAMLQ